MPRPISGQQIQFTADLLSLMFTGMGCAAFGSRAPCFGASITDGFGEKLTTDARPDIQQLIQFTLQVLERRRLPFVALHPCMQG